MKNNILISSIVLGILLVAVAFKFFFIKPSKSLIKTSQTQMLLAPTQTEIEVFEQVEGEVSTPTFATMKIGLGKTALDLLSQTHQIKTKGEKENAFITTVDNRTASDAQHEFWAFYVNGKQASVGAGSYQLQPGDKVLWKIETY